MSYYNHCGVIHHLFFFFFLNDPPTPEIYPLPLHAALPILTITPDSVPARFQLSLRTLIEEKMDDALKFARQAVALSPDSVGAQLALAKALRAKGDNEGALAAFLAAERLDPVSPAIRLYIVNAYRALDRIEDMRRETSEYERLKAEQGTWP